MCVLVQTNERSRGVEHFIKCKEGEGDNTSHDQREVSLTGESRSRAHASRVVPSVLAGQQCFVLPPRTK